MTFSPEQLMTLENAILGKHIAEVRREAAATDWQVRVVEEDGQGRRRTMDFQQNRLNVATVGNMVVKLVSVG